MSATQDVSSSPVVPPVQQANHYSLSGRGLHVEYASTSLNGQPRLTYHDAVQTRSFSGNEIRSVEVPDLGTIISVTLSIVPDVGSTTFSLLVPTVIVSNIGTPANVTTEGVTTIHRMPFVVHFVGQRENYRAVRLEGSASFLIF
jgi:hypothetical protein